MGTLTVDRPARRNALTPRMCAELAALGEGLERDHALRCLVVTGAGPAFSAGLDLDEGMAMLAEWAALPVGEELVARGLRLAESVAWIPRLRCPSVAAVRGPAYGAGGQLALASTSGSSPDDARLGLVETAVRSPKDGRRAGPVGEHTGSSKVGTSGIWAAVVDSSS